MCDHVNTHRRKRRKSLSTATHARVKPSTTFKLSRRTTLKLLRGEVNLSQHQTLAGCTQFPTPHCTTPRHVTQDTYNASAVYPFCNDNLLPENSYINFRVSCDCPAPLALPPFKCTEQPGYAPIPAGTTKAAMAAIVLARVASRAAAVSVCVEETAAATTAAVAYAAAATTAATGKRFPVHGL